MADGIISFSRPAGGYRWLILIDHPQANLFSLYGHLSPSRWKLKAGTDVERGDLIAYLGNSYEIGGSKEQPVDTHLHFGIRAGQTTDFPTISEWHYQGAWIKLCPQYMGWLQPSLVITSQEIQAGGYPQPQVGFLIHWGLDPLIIGLYIIGGARLLITSSRKNIRFLLLIQGIVAIVAGFVFHSRGLMSSYMLVVLGILILAAGIYFFIRQPILKQLDRSQTS